MKQEYVKLKGNEHLIGKRARFKNNLKGYCRVLWLKKGVIKQKFSVKKGDLDYIGLSIVFDKQLKHPKPGELNSCYIKPNSFELIDVLINVVPVHHKCHMMYGQTKEFRRKCLAYVSTLFSAEDILEWYNSVSIKTNLIKKDSTGEL